MVAMVAGAMARHARQRRHMGRRGVVRQESTEGMFWWRA